MATRILRARNRVRRTFLVALAFGLAGCGGAKDPSATAKDPSATDQSSLTAKAAFDYHVGDAVVQSPPLGDQARADNGDVVTVIGTGTFDAVAKSATGGGSFVHKTSGGTVVGKGSWAATGLLDFQSYGNGVPQGAPPNFFGGRAALKALLTPDANPSVHLPAILQIECLLGAPPAGAIEGVRLNVQNFINFNKTVPESGAAVYVQR